MEARVALKTKPTAKVPAMTWTIPKARNQPQFFQIPVASTVSKTADRSCARQSRMNLQ